MTETASETGRTTYRRLEALAYDLWWSWQADGAAFWRRLDPTLWVRSGHNPVRVLQLLGEEGVARRLDAEGRKMLASLEARRVAYLESQETWHHLAGRPCSGTVAYFSAEFGIHESLPIYSGGLGILAGDHVKSASDLGLPFVAMGLLYRHGYVRQVIDEEGRQVERHVEYDFEQWAVRRAQDDAGGPLRVVVPVDGADCLVQVWQAQVGRVVLYLLDTDLPENAPGLRSITGELYGGGVETRIKQELVLGVGGVRALRALGIAPRVFHLNEGHSSFLSLERIRELIAAGEAASVGEAVARVRRDSVFTTHTPVEAGHDRFAPDLAVRQLSWFMEAVRLDRDGLMALGRWDDEMDPGAPFNMTLLAMRTCSRLNGVARLHGEVSRQMFARMWRGTPVDEVPITHVTNGVHAPSWQGPAIYQALAAHLPEGFRDRSPPDPVWRRVFEVPDEVLWSAHLRQKEALLEVARAREAARRHRLKLPPGEDRLRADALTIGFARRFAPYKRAALLFSDLQRLFDILAHAPGPVQILFAGKAHPADQPGKGLIQTVYRASQHPELRGRVMLIEDYDIELGRALTQGVDVWLNNPRRPKEASGTSGMKAAMNGGLNCSILDGWWPEGYNGENGWALGEPRAYPSEQAQDAADADSLYRTLAEKVIPTYYDRDGQGLPRRWIRMMKSSIASCTPAFHSDRQVIDYVHHLYVPGWSE